MYSANESSTYMTSVGKGGAGVPAKGLAPAHFFPLEGPACRCSCIQRRSDVVMLSG